MPYFNLRTDFITVLLHNNLDCVRLSDRPQQSQDVNAVLFDMIFLFNCINYLTIAVDI